MFSLPINLYPVNIEGERVTFYTSPDLKLKFIQVLSLHRKTREGSKIFSELIMRDDVIPCYLDKNISSYILSKLFTSMWWSIHGESVRERMELSICKAFYSPNSGKVLVFINNNVRFLVFIMDDTLVNYVLHECCHMLADKEPNRFWNTFKRDLSLFYAYMYSKLLQIDIRDVGFHDFMESFCRYVFFNIERGTASLNKLRSIISEIGEFSTLKKKEVQERIKLINNAINMYLDNPLKYSQNYNKFILISDCINSAYAKVFGRFLSDNLPIQEFIFPSEIIALSSEITEKTSKIINSFKVLI